jgi:hypothetical protein
MDHKSQMNQLREELARRELEKSCVLTSIASPATSATRMQQAISRIVDLDQEIRKILAQLQASSAEATARPRPGPPKLPRHRLNRDGSFDSICIHCFATIASSRREQDLELAERNHICDPDTLKRILQRSSRATDPPRIRR